jgi:hypothetical protein
MGREQVKLEAYATVSRHNSPEDDADNAAWNKFVRAVNEAAAANDLFIDVMADGELPTGRWGHADT